MSGSNYYGENPEVEIGGSLALETAPEGHGTAAYSVKSGSEDYCSVEESRGVVTGEKPGDCTIQVEFAESENYHASLPMDVATITVLERAQTITINNPYGTTTMAVEETLALVNAPTALIENNEGESVEGGGITYQLAPTTATEGTCSVAADGTITALIPGDCTIMIQVAAIADDGTRPVYRAEERELATITVEKGTFPFIWSPYLSGVDYRTGTEQKIARVDVGTTGATVVYTVTDDGDTECDFKGNAGEDAVTLSFGGYGVCTVKAVASKEHYEDWSMETNHPGQTRIDHGGSGTVRWQRHPGSGSDATQNTRHPHRTESVGCGGLLAVGPG